MKTKFLKIATVLLIMTAGSKSFAGIPENHSTSTVFNWINNFYKIEVHGNVHVHLLSGDQTKVEMNDNYFNNNALMQIENEVLRITCYSAETLNVWITVNDLRVLAAYDNVLIDTQGKFSSIDLDVELYNKAKADMDLDCFSTHIKLNDHSMANITGTAMEANLAINYSATLNSTYFGANQLSKNRIAPINQAPAELRGLNEAEALLSAASDTTNNKTAFIGSH